MANWPTVNKSPKDWVANPFQMDYMAWWSSMCWHVFSTSCILHVQCLEKVKIFSQQIGLMAIYHGKKAKNHLKQIQDLQIGFHTKSTRNASNTNGFLNWDEGMDIQKYRNTWTPAYLLGWPGFCRLNWTAWGAELLYNAEFHLTLSDPVIHGFPGKWIHVTGWQAENTSICWCI